MAEPVVCAGCALLCDDVTAELTETSGRLRPSCDLGSRWLSARVGAPASPPATIDGEPAAVEAALARAAELLREASRPLLHGFTRATTEDARAAVALADRIGAIVATEPVGGPWRGVAAVPLRGASTATLGEIRDRSRVVVIWREDPESTHPRLLHRLGLAGGESGPRRDPGRTLVVVDDRDTDTARRADIRLSWPAGRDLEALRWLRAARHGAAGEDATFGALAELLGSAPHAAILHGAGLTAGTGGQRRALALHDLTRALNASHHVVTLSLTPAPGLRGAEDVLAWQTGYPGIVDLAPGHPELPVATADLVDHEGIDLALCVEGSTARARGDLTEIALGAPPQGTVAVSIQTATPGVGATGTAHRLDGIPLTLRAPVPSEAPTAAALLRRLHAELAR